MIYIANPIYDVVFKYLMEDERVVKILLSALLKTWLETETLRFRQYLGAQYANPDNMLKDDEHISQGIPMVAVYLLGHRVGDIEEPVLYVKHESYDYEGNVVTKGLPDPFVESLTHNSILVQIPRLHGHVNNRLEEILSIFDQTRKNRDNRQVIDINEADYADDAEMMLIIHRLLAAAADAQVRQDMNAEEIYLQPIEDRDTAIMQRDKQLAEKEEQLAEKEEQLVQSRSVIFDLARHLKASGQSVAQIAALAKLTEEEIRNL